MAFIPPQQSVISTINSTATPLGISGVFTGTSENITQYAVVTVYAFATTAASATDGLSIQQSADGTNWDIIDAYTVPAGTGKTFSVQVTAQFYRVIYTNSATAQGVFRLQTIFHYNGGVARSVRPQDARTNDNDMDETLAYLMGYNGTTWDRLRTTGTGVLTTSGVLTAGTAIVGKFGIDQTIVGTTNGVSLAQLGATTIATGNGVAGTGVQRVTIASDTTTNTNPFLVTEQKSATASLTSVAGSTTSGTLLAANTARKGAYFYNDSTAILYLAYAATASTTAYTIQIASNGFYEMPEKPLYTGLVTGIWAASAGNVRITELS